jgi:Icc-related predicted phosphoesterase
MKIAAIGDLHCEQNSQGKIRKLIQPVEDKADVLVLAGDLTNSGRIEEMEVLLEELNGFTLPIIAVMGNHDHEAGQVELLEKMMASRGICVLQSTSCRIGEAGFVGTKGFCGGFGEYRIQPFGERAIKKFVQASVDEVLNMEAALEQLDGMHKVGVVHYAPIKATLVGESPELYPFLGTSLLESAFDRKRVDVIFHGHAHHGALQGHTRGGIPVFNVSQFARALTGETPYLIYELQHSK